MPETLAIQMRTHEVFETIAEKYAQKDAVVCDGERLSYERLNSRANQLAHCLIAQGVKHEEPVGVAFEKSCDLIVAVLGILKAGAAYVPLGENLPIQRLRAAIDDAGCKRVVVQRGHLDELWTGDESLISLDETDGFSDENPMLAGSPDDLMYILYTSGSTGEPKGVQIEHAGVVRLVQGQDYLPFGPELNYLFLGPISFDLSTLGIFGPLMSGATMVIDPSLIPDAAQLEKLIREEDVRASLVIFGLFNSLFEARPEVFETMTDILVGGEAVWSSIMRRAMTRLPNIRFVNVYGPTEATVLSTSYRIDSLPSDEIATVPIGKPLASMTHVVVDADLVPVEPGELGELCMVGVGLARGYLNCPELTAQKFPVIQLSDGQSERVYRTGDRVYELADGNIVFDGRIDDQVKVRGFRIELGAIEAAVEQIESVHRAAVVVAGIGDAAKIYARVVGESFDRAEMVEELGRSLPEYMIPDEILLVDALPVTENGKVDKRAVVQEIESELSENERALYTPPETETQSVFCSIWEEVLGVEQVGVDESFLDLGGHSLRAVVVCSRVRDRLGLELPVSVVFTERTIRKITAWAEDSTQSKGAEARIPKADRSEPVPLSFNQERLWMLDQIHPDDSSYNIAIRILFQGDLDEGILRQAWWMLHERHEVLRTQISESGQVVLDLDEMSPLFHWEDEIQEDALHEKETGLFSASFDLAEVPLAKLTAYKLSDDRSVIAVCMHHIISDAWSCDVLRRELAEIYESIVEDRAPDLPELSIQYADFAVWQRGYVDSAEYESNLAHWADRLQDAPFVDLPADFPRTSEVRNEGQRVRFDFPEDLVDRVRQVSRGYGATPNIVLLAAFNAWIHRLTGSEGVVVGMPIANREHSSVEPLIGFFMETIAFHVGMQGSDSFDALLGRTADEFWSAIDHRNVPFQHVIEAIHGHTTPGRNPLFEVFFNYIPLKIRGGDGSRFAFDLNEVDNGTAKFDLTCYVFDDDDSMSVVFNYRSALFSQGTMQRYLEQFVTLLDDALKDPQRPLSAIKVLPEQEQLAWESMRQQEALDHLPSGGLVDAINKQIESNPESVAIESGFGSLTYRELALWSGGACEQIRSLGVGKGDRVVVGLRDPRQMGAAILGVLRAGGMYVPVDLGWPPARIEQVISQCAAKAVIVDADVGARLGTQSASPTDWSVFDDVLERIQMNGDDPAYMLFTSGSTGQPKGVVQSHRSTIEHNSVFAHSLGLDSTDRLLMTSSQAFDAAPMDMYGAWLTGAAWCPFDLQRGAGPELAGFIEEHRITVFHAAPTVLRWFASTDPDLQMLGSVRLIVMGGEQARSTDLDLIREMFPNCKRVVNGFGLTESSVSLQQEIQLHDESWSNRRALPIGRATPGTSVRLVDTEGNATALYGEIELESTRVASGYWNAEKHELQPLGIGSNQDGSTRFRTGDMARMLPDGTLESQGRRDHQVQVHGCRVEMGEVQSALCGLDDVQDAAVVPVRIDSGEHELHAYVMMQCDSEVAVSDLRSRLSTVLPGYMIPSAWSLVDKIDRVGGGKIDLASLIAASREHDEVADSGLQRALSPTEQVIASAFREVLSCEDVHAGSDFFALGGNSLKAIHVFSLLRERLEMGLAVSCMFQSPTVEELARIVDSEQTGSHQGCFIPMRKGNGGHFIYLLPGNGGHPLGFGPVLTEVGPTGSYIGVQLPGIDDTTELIENIEGLATHLIEKINIPVGSLAPNLIGYSFGGALAFEMALQYQERGHPPGVLVLLDSHNLNGLPKKGRLGRMVEHALAVLGRGDVNGLSYIMQKLRGTAVTAYTPMTKKTGNATIDRMIQVNRKAIIMYSPGRVYDGDTVLVRAQQPSWLRFHKDDGMNGWGRWMGQGKMSVHDIDIRHIALLHEPSAPELARILERELFPDSEQAE